MRYVKAVRVILFCSVGVVGRPGRRGRLKLSSSSSTAAASFRLLLPLGRAGVIIS